MIKKDRLTYVNKTYLMKMMHQLYQSHLKSQFSQAEYLLFQILIALLQSIKKVSLESLATAMPMPILFESRRKKLQRFLSLSKLQINKIWFPVVKIWLDAHFTSEEMVEVVIDRTSWACTNLFMISIVWNKRSFPVYFELLPKLGCSNFDEQKRIISQVLPVFKEHIICVLGDREFCSVSLANWLGEQGTKFCLRLKKNEFVEVQDKIYTELNMLGLSPGTSFFLQGVKVTKRKNKDFRGFNVAGKWQRKNLGQTPKEGWFILTNLDSLPAAISAYKKRFGIEEMFRDFKSGGYNLEDTNVSGQRLISLILLISFAYMNATLQGQEIKSKGVQKYIGRVKENGRVERRHSSFYIGLHGQSWVNLREHCIDLVNQLMRLNCNKQKYYQQGMRAKRLVMSVS